MDKATRSFLAATVAAALCASGLHGWGAKGHEMTARAAVGAMPVGTPAFFRAAQERLAYLCPEPDRWRGDTAPTLGQLRQPDHYFNLEDWGSDPLPGKRYDLVLAAVKRGIVDDKKSVRDLGSAHVAIAELAEQLTTHFRQWRETVAPGRKPTPREAAVRRQVEEAVIFTAGIVAHFVTDLGNPMHTTAHHNGWDETYPNPRRFLTAKEARAMHVRFESVFVDRAFELPDFAPRIPPPQRLGPWAESMEKFIRRNNLLVETVYEMESKVAFGSGNETAEQKAFVAERLAGASSMLRDVWHTAWLNSGDEWLNESVTVYGRAGKTLLELTREQKRLTVRRFPNGQLVTGIGNRANGTDARTWMYYVGGKHGPTAADRFTPAPGQRVEWRFERSGAK